MDMHDKRFHLNIRMRRIMFRLIKFAYFIR